MDDAGSDTFTWSTTNKTVATVKNGVVTARKPGYAMVYATNGNKDVGGIKVYVYENDKKPYLDNLTLTNGSNRKAGENGTWLNEKDTDAIDIHVQNAAQDISVFTAISEDALFEKVRQIFFYSLHNEAISRFRRMMTIEQFRSPELAALYSQRYVERVVAYHAGIFRSLIAAGEIRDEDPDTLALLYVAPVITLIGICDRQPEKEEECLERLKTHVQIFFRTFHADHPREGGDQGPR